MLNKIVAILSLLVSIKAYAIDLNCEIKKGLNTNLIPNNSFVIKSMSTDQAIISLDGGLFKAPQLIGENLITTFSNECDNMIEIKFNVLDFLTLKKSSKKQIIGEINYSSIEVEDILMNQDSVKALINCKKL